MTIIRVYILVGLSLGVVLSGCQKPEGNNEPAAAPPAGSEDPAADPEQNGSDDPTGATLADGFVNAIGAALTEAGIDAAAVGVIQTGASGGTAALALMESDALVDVVPKVLDGATPAINEALPPTADNAAARLTVISALAKTAMKFSGDHADQASSEESNRLPGQIGARIAENLGSAGFSAGDVGAALSKLSGEITAGMDVSGVAEADRGAALEDFVEKTMDSLPAIPDFNPTDMITGFVGEMIQKVDDGGMTSDVIARVVGEAVAELPVADADVPNAIDEIYNAFDNIENSGLANTEFATILADSTAEITNKLGPRVKAANDAGGSVSIDTAIQTILTESILTTNAIDFADDAAKLAAVGGVVERAFGSVDEALAAVDDQTTATDVKNKYDDYLVASVLPHVDDLNFADSASFGAPEVIGQVFQGLAESVAASGVDAVPTAAFDAALGTFDDFELTNAEKADAAKLMIGGFVDGLGRSGTSETDVPGELEEKVNLVVSRLDNVGIPKADVLTAVPNILGEAVAKLGGLGLSQQGLVNAAQSLTTATIGSFDEAGVTDSSDLQGAFDELAAKTYGQLAELSAELNLDANGKAKLSGGFAAGFNDGLDRAVDASVAADLLGPLQKEQIRALGAELDESDPGFETILKGQLEGSAGTLTAAGLSGSVQVGAGFEDVMQNTIEALKETTASTEQLAGLLDGTMEVIKDEIGELAGSDATAKATWFKRAVGGALQASSTIFNGEANFAEQAQQFAANVTDAAIDVADDLAANDKSLFEDIQGEVAEANAENLADLKVDGRITDAEFQTATQYITKAASDKLYEQYLVEKGELGGSANLFDATFSGAAFSEGYSTGLVTAGVDSTLRNQVLISAKDGFVEALQDEEEIDSSELMAAGSDFDGAGNIDGQSACEGGDWNSSTQTCVMPTTEAPEDLAENQRASDAEEDLCTAAGGQIVYASDKSYSCDTGSPYTTEAACTEAGSVWGEIKAVGFCKAILETFTPDTQAGGSNETTFEDVSLENASPSSIP